MIKKTLKKINFNRSQRNAIFILTIIFLISTSVSIFNILTHQEHRTVQLSKQEIEAIEQLLIQDSIERIKKKKKPSLSSSFFKKQQKANNINPNKLSTKDWEKVGFSRKQAQALIRYKYKIGGFKNLEQFKNAYVVNDFMFNKLKDVLFFKDKNHNTSQQIKNDTIEINKANAKEFKKLYGIGEKLSNRIVKYREKIGGFHNINQISEVFGISDSIFQYIKPNLKCISKKMVSKTIDLVTSRTKKIEETIEINKANAKEFKTLYGIGEKLSNRIIKYRQKLGNFHTINQISEVFGINDSIFQHIKSRLKCTSPKLTKISINEANEKTLKSHPYISWVQAKEIVNFRYDWNTYTHINELVKEKILTQKEFEKLKPYIKL